MSSCKNTCSGTLTGATLGGKGSCGAGITPCGGCNGGTYGNTNSNCTGCGNTCGGGCSAGVASGNGAVNCWCGSNCSGCGGCSNKCSGCSGSCSGCSGSCGGSCIGGCTGTCENTCKGTCDNTCTGTCENYCKGSCSIKCSGSCGHLCNVGCSNQVAIEANTALENLKNDNNYLLDYILYRDINYILSMLQEEGRRRLLKKAIEVNLTDNEKEQIGLNIIVNEEDYATDIFINNIITLLSNNINYNVKNKNNGNNDKIKKELGAEIISALLAAYSAEIPVHTTSNYAGEEE